MFARFYKHKNCLQFIHSRFTQIGKTAGIIKLYSEGKRSRTGSLHSSEYVLPSSKHPSNLKQKARLTGGPFAFVFIQPHGGKGPAFPVYPIERLFRRPLRKTPRSLSSLFQGKAGQSFIFIRKIGRIFWFIRKFRMCRIVKDIGQWTRQEKASKEAS